MALHILDQADTEYTYCDRDATETINAVSVDNMDRDLCCAQCVQEFDSRY